LSILFCLSQYSNLLELNWLDHEFSTQKAVDTVLKVG
jgi:hypothetical protein